jgi:hypothetical protein
MGSDDRSAPAGHHNPVTDVEATHVGVTLDVALNAVAFEVTDGSGTGFRTLLDLDQALDAALRLVSSVMRLKGLAAP